MRAVQPDHFVLALVGFFGGAAHALPPQLYIAEAIGPFDVLVLLLLLHWLVLSPRRISPQARRQYLLFYCFAAVAYIGEIGGAIVFGTGTLSSLLAPFRFLYYPTLFITLVPFLGSPLRLRILFSGYVLGVLAISAIAWIHSPDPGFFFGLPVLDNPNVIGNFIGYAMICLGFAFMPRGLAVKGSALLALFVFAMFTFSKASWLLALGGMYLNAMRFNRWLLLLVIVVAAAIAVSVLDLKLIFDMVSNAIDLKLSASVGDDTTGGTLDMRIGFFQTSMYSLFDHPFGVGLKNFWLLNRSYEDVLGSRFFESESPHMALGYAAVQAGWIGIALLCVITYRVMTALFSLYSAPSLGTRAALFGMILISILFQIEILTQPFIYLVLASAMAQAEATQHAGSISGPAPVGAGLVPAAHEVHN
jgi:hypothetical protein